MATSMNDGRSKDSSNRDGAVPSGFILKLYQMVNGAPDDIISWTPSGDAFKIGADLNKLESETLPQYFRHSRFQSLVRQLNFYNFRKVNRERTFWIYKHRLFHRDRPQDLHLLRRRTCPGVDGRKNRFASSLRKQTAGEQDRQVDNDSHNSSKHSSEDSTEDDDSGSESVSPKSVRKRRGYLVERADEVKRPRRGGSWRSQKGGGYDGNARADDSVSLDLSARGGKLQAKQCGVRTEEVQSRPEEDEASLSETDERMRRREQAHIVSQVAMKLEEYARKAKRGLGRTRAKGGIVTPPLGGGQLPSGFYYRSLITYDDEYEAMARRSSSAANIPVVTDGESMASDDDLGGRTISEANSPRKVKREPCMKAPVEDVEMVRQVTGRIDATKSNGFGGFPNASAVLAGFCMSTAPGSPDLCTKVIQLLSSCERLALEFQQYMAALQPNNCASDLLPSSTFSNGVRSNHPGSGRKIWDRAACREDAVRDFKTFAVNYIQNGLQVRPGPVEFTDEEVAALRRTADVWLKSVA